MTPTTGACGMCVMPMIFCFGLAGPPNEAIKIKYKVAQVLNNNLKLELNAMHRNLEKVLLQQLKRTTIPTGKLFLLSRVVSYGNH